MIELLFDRNVETVFWIDALITVLIIAAVRDYPIPLSLALAFAFVALFVIPPLSAWLMIKKQMKAAKVVLPKPKPVQPRIVQPAPEAARPGRRRRGVSRFMLIE